MITTPSSNDNKFCPPLPVGVPNDEPKQPGSGPWQALLNVVLSRIDVNPYVTAATEYAALNERLRQRIHDEDAAAMAKRLDLTISAYYNKRRGIKPFVAADVEVLTHYFNDPADRRVLKRYHDVRNALCATVATLPLDRNELIRRSGLTYHEFYRRSKVPTLWRHEELLRMGHAMASLKAELCAKLPREFISGDQ